MKTLPVGIGRGLRLEIDFAHHTKLWLGLYEVELNRTLRRLCRPGTRSFDVGAQYGYDALVAAKLTSAPVASFECDPQAVEVIRRNLDANPRLGRLVHVEEAFVGVGAGELRLDDFAERWGAPGFVKIDVEGGEADVLRGAARLLRSTHPSLLVEVHSVDLERECADLLASAGYRLSVVNQRRLLRDHRPWAGHNRWLVAV